MMWPYLGVAQAFREVLLNRRLVLPDDESRDVVSAVLGSQFVFMAGPSGTGKSAVAEALGALFTRPERFRRLQVPLGIATESELYGYPTTIGGHLRFQPSSWLGQFGGLAPPAGAGGAAAPLVLPPGEQFPAPPTSPAVCPPVLLFEEANLGIIEGYLSSFVRDLSGMGCSQVEIALHGGTGPIDRTGGGPQVPPRLVVGRWPRLIATLNVDQTAEPPSRKVAARALAVVLEPPELSVGELRATSLGGAQPPPPAQHYFQALGRPNAAVGALASYDDDLFTAVVEDVHRAAEALSAVLRLPPVVSPRNLLRMVSFQATHLLVGLGEGDAAEPTELLRQLGLEYAMLHIILPSLSEEHFIRVRDSVGTAESRAFSPLACDDATEQRSPLMRRLKTVSAGRAATDFWSALS